MAPAAMLWLEQFPQLCLFARPTNILYNDTSKEKQLLIFTSHGEAARGELPTGQGRVPLGRTVSDPDP